MKYMRSTYPGLYSPLPQQKRTSEPLGSTTPTNPSDNKATTNGEGAIHYENEKGMTTSPSKEEIELNCKNIKRTDSFEKLGRLFFKLRYFSYPRILKLILFKC